MSLFRLFELLTALIAQVCSERSIHSFNNGINAAVSTASVLLAHRREIRAAIPGGLSVLKGLRKESKPALKEYRPEIADPLLASSSVKRNDLRVCVASLTDGKDLCGVEPV